VVIRIISLSEVKPTAQRIAAAGENKVWKWQTAEAQKQAQKTRTQSAQPFGSPDVRCRGARRKVSCKGCVGRPSNKND